jgi:hypothetical protein
MRRFALLALSFTVFGSAIALNRQDSPPAEQVFRNIQSFKGSKASDVIPAMEFMSASLGVGCDFCHTADRASDDKHMKVVARMMITMQHDINDKNFKGRNQVTCATCHGGHAHPVAVPPVAGLQERARPSETVVPAQVLAAYGTAATGSPSRPLDALRLSGTVTEHGEKSPVEEVYQAGKFAVDVRAPKGEMKSGYNGTSAWFTTPKGNQMIPAMYATARLNERLVFTGPDSLPKLDGMAGGTATVGGHDCLVVTGTMADKTRVALFFDKSTSLLTRTAYTYPTILGNIAQINDYSDYRKVDGVMVPFTVASHDQEGDTIFQFRSIRGNQKLAPADFEPPK